MGFKKNFFLAELMASCLQAVALPLEPWPQPKRRDLSQLQLRTTEVQRTNSDFLSGEVEGTEDEPKKEKSQDGGQEGGTTQRETERKPEAHHREPRDTAVSLVQLRTLGYRKISEALLQAAGELCVHITNNREKKSLQERQSQFLQFSKTLGHFTYVFVLENLLFLKDTEVFSNLYTFFTGNIFMFLKGQNTLLLLYMKKQFDFYFYRTNPYFLNFFWWCQDLNPGPCTLPLSDIPSPEGIRVCYWKLENTDR